ncbi:aminotransferase-like domain-containing protein [Kutzneria sp. CA-103260]|uniref:aminotransferase-like domain-containing protein n=1 Tax=Kutzneria sp. CA-103260 TaxID=2802641 RepID=UPI001BADA5E3|nr:PLP-dependent aminotransferase family protein [Kutzneria sp. CA-103260]QUQ72198.1 PLP-dependent aminotransferase family protein [Kutzneria sp. CA-103260]
MNEDNAEQGVIRLLRAAAHGVGPGGRLPSVRAIMQELRVSPVTVQHAMRRLEAEGVIEVRASKGAFAGRRQPTPEVPDLEWQAVALGAKPAGEESLRDLMAMPSPEMVPLSGGYLDPELQPVAALGAALGRASRRPEAWARGPVEGREELRAWFARQAGGAFRAADMVVCPGGQAALSTAFRALTAPGDVVLAEAPTYLGAIATARSSGLQVVAVPADADGVRPDLLDAAFTRTDAKVFYCQPLYANPHGAVLSPERRPEVLAVLAKHGAFLIEDDFARDMVIDGTPPPPLAADDIHGHVIYLRSLTKSAAPGLRVAAIGARGAAGARLRSARVLDDFFVAGPLQLAALELLSSPAWQRHLKALRPALKARRDALLTALATELPQLRPVTVPSGGMQAWVRLPDGVDDLALTASAAAHGVVVSAGRPWYATDPPAAHLRLTFAGAPPEVLIDGIHRLANAATAIGLRPA